MTATDLQTISHVKVAFRQAFGREVLAEHAQGKLIPGSSYAKTRSAPKDTRIPPYRDRRAP